MACITAEEAIARMPKQIPDLPIYLYLQCVYLFWRFIMIIIFCLGYYSDKNYRFKPYTGLKHSTLNLISYSSRLLSAPATAHNVAQPVGIRPTPNLYIGPTLSLYRIILKCCSFQADLQSWRIITARLYCFAHDSENLIGLKYMTTKSKRDSSKVYRSVANRCRLRIDIKL